MHEVSLGQTIRDYLTGEHIDKTTYEDLRQALARLLVEEKGYPASALKPKVGVRFPVASDSAAGTGEQAGEEEYCRTIDLAVYDAESRPMLILLFCPGQVNTYRRESLAAARLFPGGPVPLVVITDTREAMLVSVQDDVILGEGMHAIPVWDWLKRLVAEHAVQPLSPERMLAEQRILHTYSEFIKKCCDESLCML